jgi:hypothetical protein
LGDSVGDKRERGAAENAVNIIFSEKLDSHNGQGDHHVFPGGRIYKVIMPAAIFSRNTASRKKMKGSVTMKSKLQQKVLIAVK